MRTIAHTVPTGHFQTLRVRNHDAGTMMATPHQDSPEPQRLHCGSPAEAAPDWFTEMKSSWGRDSAVAWGRSLACVRWSQLCSASAGGFAAAAAVAAAVRERGERGL